MTTERTQRLFEHVAGYNFSYFGPEPFFGDDGQADCGLDCPVDPARNEAASAANRLTEILNVARG